MPCRLYTGEAYAIRYETQAYDEWMLSFFLNGHMEDYLVLYDSNDNFKGLVTYAGFIKNGLGGGYLR